MPIFILLILLKSNIVNNLAQVFEMNSGNKISAFSVDFKRFLLFECSFKIGKECFFTKSICHSCKYHISLDHLILWGNRHTGIFQDLDMIIEGVPEMQVISGAINQLISQSLSTPGQERWDTDKSFLFKQCGIP